MRSRDARPLITCLAVVLLFVVVQFNVTMMSSIKGTHSTKRQDRISRVPESIRIVERLNDPPRQSTPAKEISCDRNRFYDICRINGPSVLDPTVSTLFVMNPTSSTPRKPLVEKVRPYARKWLNSTMREVKEVTLVAGPPTPKCDVKHAAPALVFSAGNYSDNFFHEFKDGLIPLYITVNTLFPDQDVVFVISKPRDWWITKYKELLTSFSKYPIINLDKDTAIHCFPSASVGMLSHGFMTIDPKLTPKSKTFADFHVFLDQAYGQRQEFQNQNYSCVSNLRKDRPRLLLSGRRGAIGRVLLNQNEVKLEAEKVGFEVIIFEPTPATPLREAYALINSSHAMVGIHGAALTHSLFLRPGSVFVQVVPLGLELLGDVCFGKSARAMGLEYMEYWIRAEESSLIEKCNKDKVFIKDASAVAGNCWSNQSMAVYMRQQNVKLDLVRFREYLRVVYVKAKNFMERVGK